MLKWRDNQCSFFALYAFFCEMEKDCFKHANDEDYASFRSWLYWQMSMHVPKDRIAGQYPMQEVVVATPTNKAKTRKTKNQ